MKNKILIFVFLLLSVFTLISCGENPTDKVVVNKVQPVYSNMIKSVEDVGVITGIKGFTDTYTKYNIGGTDLGIPYYDSTRGQMYLLFGDTFDGINKMTGNWRSQTVGISSDFNLKDGLTFDSFISDDSGKAIQIIDSMHDGNSAGGERTCIPTGGIEINGIHYVFYMSIREWLTGGWDINFCTVAKSTDGKNFEVLTDLYWAEDAEIGQMNVEMLLDREKDEIQLHETSHFLQIFPYRVDDYVYLYGIGAGRYTGCKLGRVKVEDFENFDEYEYYTGKDQENNPVWVKGAKGLSALKNNEASYIVEPQVGELGVCYNEYLGKYVMSYFSRSKIVMRTSDNLIDWDEIEIITTAAEYVQLYGGFTHELYMEQDGKVMYFLISQYQNDTLGEEGYNVRLLRVTFK